MCQSSENPASQPGKANNPKETENPGDQMNHIWIQALAEVLCFSLQCNVQTYAFT